MPIDPVVPSDAAPPAVTSPAQPASVSNCHLQMRKVNLVFLLCSPGPGQERHEDKVEVETKGELVADSVGDTRFEARVTWSLKFPGEAEPPVVISGTHQMEFATSSRPNDRTARYYAEINSVVLIYPYLRQLISDLTFRCLGYSITIDPLDVPGFMLEQRQKIDDALASRETDAGGGPDAEDGD